MFSCFYEGATFQLSQHQTEFIDPDSFELLTTQYADVPNMTYHEFLTNYSKYTGKDFNRGSPIPVDTTSVQGGG